MAATARFVVLMKPAEKARIEKAAKAAHLSAGEYARQRLFGNPDDQAIEALLEAMHPEIDRLHARIEAAMAAIRRSGEGDDDRDVIEQIRRRLGDADIAATADALRLTGTGGR